MISCILTTLAIALLTAASSDHEQFQGKWKLVLCVTDHSWSDGKLSPSFNFITFTSDERVTERVTDMPVDRDTVVLHPDRMSSAIELHSRDADGRAALHVGVYELKDDTLNGWFRFGSQELPQSFTCRAWSRSIVLGAPAGETRMPRPGPS